MAGKLMAYKDMFTVLVVDSRIERSQSLRDAFGRILGHLRDDHHLHTDVLGTTRDAVTRLRNDASVACLLLEGDGKTGGIDRQRVVAAIEDIGLEIPVFLLASGDDLGREQHGLLADAVRGLIYPEEDAPDFVAKYINRHFEAYIEQLKTPFFGRIIEFNESSNEMWTCPGHNGGMFCRRSRSWWLIRGTPADVLGCGRLAGHDLGLRLFFPPSSRPQNRVCHVRAARLLARAGSADRGGDHGEVPGEAAPAAGGADPRPAGRVAA